MKEEPPLNHTGLIPIRIVLTITLHRTVGLGKPTTKAEEATPGIVPDLRVARVNATAIAGARRARRLVLQGPLPGMPTLGLRMLMV